MGARLALPGSQKITAPYKRIHFILGLNGSMLLYADSYHKDFPKWVSNGIHCCWQQATAT